MSALKTFKAKMLEERKLVRRQNDREKLEVKMSVEKMRMSGNIKNISLLSLSSG